MLEPGSIFGLTQPLTGSNPLPSTQWEQPASSSSPSPCCADFSFCSYGKGDYTTSISSPLIRFGDVNLLHRKSKEYTKNDWRSMSSVCWSHSRSDLQLHSSAPRGPAACSGEEGSSWWTGQGSRRERRRQQALTCYGCGKHTSPSPFPNALV